MVQSESQIDPRQREQKSQEQASEGGGDGQRNRPLYRYAGYSGKIRTAARR
ncbi:hypothetical protein NT01EI_0783 [Edwardsiella ictaluri 93-146]|uniref:Uncharacterized protein n=1 Tax=Edwardsiella ictaluri (strain 93-146) TaxID=634503 RepID=C5B9K3_EDWI9|nr:hypothetical protein NT01EI_0783 [Edwardsiella ictaluri 93-146]